MFFIVGNTEKKMKKYTSKLPKYETVLFTH